MYHFAICDDEPGERGKTNALLAEYRKVRPGCDFAVESFSSVPALTDKIEGGAFFDLLLLDVYMPGKTGVEGAGELRRGGYEGQIIFLTTSKEHAIDAFEVGAAHYLLKPIEQARFFAALDWALERVNKECRKYLVLRTDGEARRIAFRDIVYAESQNQYQSLHLADGEEVLTRMTLTELYESIGAFPDFARAGSTYIVNLGYVDTLSAKLVRLSTGKEIRLPRGSYSLLKERYFAFYRDGREEHI